MANKSRSFISSSTWRHEPMALKKSASRVGRAKTNRLVYQTPIRNFSPRFRAPRMAELHICILDHHHYRRLEFHPHRRRLRVLLPRIRRPAPFAPLSAPCKRRSAPFALRYASFSPRAMRWLHLMNIHDKLQPFINLPYSFFGKSADFFLQAPFKQDRRDVQGAVQSEPAQNI